MSENLKSNFAVGLLRILGKLPLWGLHSIARLFLVAMLLFPNQTVKQTRINIQRCWPNLTSQQQAKLVRKSVLHTLYAALEMGLNWTQSSQRGLDHIISVTGGECLQQAQATGAIVLLTPHLGNWELFANWSAHQANVTALYKAAKLPGLDRLIHQARSNAGMKLAPATAKGVMQLKRSLVKGEVSLILPDQEPPPAAGIISQWFGQPAYTMTLAAQLADTKNTRVILGFARRLANSEGFTIELEDISDLCSVHAGSGSDSEVLAAKVQAINTSIERLVRCTPEQYQWEYRRFKHTL